MARVAGAPEGSGRWRLVYDGDCRLCQWSAWAMVALDRAGKLQPMTFDEAADEPGMGIADRDLRSAFHLMAPDGRRWSGGDALPSLAALLWGPRVARALAALAMRVLERGLYSWVARHRGALSRLLPPAPPVRRRSDS